MNKFCAVLVLLVLSGSGCLHRHSLASASILQISQVNQCVDAQMVWVHHLGRCMTTESFEVLWRWDFVVNPTKGGIPACTPALFLQTSSRKKQPAACYIENAADRDRIFAHIPYKEP